MRKRRVDQAYFELICEQVRQASELYIKLTECNETEAMKWISTPNEFLFNESPLSYFVLGEGQPIIDFLKSRLNLVADQCF